MRLITSNSFKISLLLVFGMLLYTTSFGQLKRSNVVHESKAKARKSEPNVVLVNTSTVNEIMEKCIQNGIENVQFVFTRIRPGDVQEYVANHPDAKGYEKDLIGKLTVLIKVEGNVDESSFFDADNEANLINSINNAGFRRVNKPYGGIAPAKGVLYLEIGSICPPPTSCN